MENFVSEILPNIIAGCIWSALIGSALWYITGQIRMLRKLEEINKKLPKINESK